MILFCTDYSLIWAKRAEALFVLKAAASRGRPCHVFEIGYIATFQSSVGLRFIGVVLNWYQHLWIEIDLRAKTSSQLIESPQILHCVRVCAPGSMHHISPYYFSRFCELIEYISKQIYSWTICHTGIWALQGPCRSVARGSSLSWVCPTPAAVGSQTSYLTRRQHVKQRKPVCDTLTIKPFLSITLPLQSAPIVTHWTHFC